MIDCVTTSAHDLRLGFQVTGSAGWLPPLMVFCDGHVDIIARPSGRKRCDCKGFVVSTTAETLAGGAGTFAVEMHYRFAKLFTELHAGAETMISVRDGKLSVVSVLQHPAPRRRKQLVFRSVVRASTEVKAVDYRTDRPWSRLVEIPELETVLNFFGKGAFISHRIGGRLVITSKDYRVQARSRDRVSLGREGAFVLGSRVAGDSINIGRRAVYIASRGVVSFHQDRASQQPAIRSPGKPVTRKLLTRKECPVALPTLDGVVTQHRKGYVLRNKNWEVVARTDA